MKPLVKDSYCAVLVTAKKTLLFMTVYYRRVMRRQKQTRNKRVTVMLQRVILQGPSLILDRGQLIKDLVLLFQGTRGIRPQWCPSYKLEIM